MVMMSRSGILLMGARNLNAEVNKANTKLMRYPVIAHDIKGNLFQIKMPTSLNWDRSVFGYCIFQ
jgi:hypothetical protein